MSGFRRGLGDAAERLARAYLRGLGREIIESNFHSRFGEIDIIARDGGVVCFVEVRGRSRTSFASSAESVDAVKKKKLILTAESWLAQQEKEWPCRFDVVEVELSGNSAHVVRIIEGAFDASGE